LIKKSNLSFSKENVSFENKMYYLKNTNSNGMGCLCSQEFEPTQPFQQDKVDGKFLSNAIHTLGINYLNNIKQPASYKPWKTRAKYNEIDGMNYTVMSSNPMLGSMTSGGKSDSIAPINEKTPTRMYQSSFVPASMQRTTNYSVHNPARKVGVKFPKSYGLNEQRQAGYKMEHFDVAPTQMYDEPSPFALNNNYNEFQPVDYGNTIVGSPYQMQSPYQTPYSFDARSYYDSLGYPNFNSQPVVGYDFSGGSTPQISIDSESYNQLPYGYRENFVPHPARYGQISHW